MGQEARPGTIVADFRPGSNPDHLAALNAAFARAQGEFETLVKEKVTDTGSYKFKYASLDAVLAACRPALAKHGLAVTQLLETNGTDRLSLRTELRHADGGVLGSSFPFPRVPDKPQELGSLITYMRRYALQALLGVAAEEDDDGAKAQAAEPVKPAAAAKPDRKTLKPSGPMVDKLNVLVGQLRGGGHITTEQLYLAIGKLRNVDGIHLINELDARDDEGVVHWKPLRESLNRPEANQLLDWLEHKRDQVEANQIPFGELPADY